jgi:hypothetical protein
MPARLIDRDLVRRNSLRNLPFSRVFTAVVIANFLTLAVMNLLQLPVYMAVFIFLGGTVTGLQLAGQLHPRGGRPTLDKTSLWIAIVALVLLTVPRLIYALQWVPGTEVRVIGDDYAHLAELASMTLSSSYPLRSPSSPDFLFSFYYASFYPPAVLFMALPFLTLKDALIAGNFFYHLLIVLSIVEIGHLFFRGAGQIRWFVFLMTFFSGLDWLAKPLQLTTTYEWWQKDYFRANTQISSFYTGMYWTIHHVVGFWAIVLCAVWLFYAFVPGVSRSHTGHGRLGRRHSGHRWQKPLVISLLAAGAFFSSPFSVLPLPFFAALHWRLLWRHVLRTWMFAYAAVLGTIPLFLFLHRQAESALEPSSFRLQVTGEFWLDKLISLPIFLVLVPLVEFAAIPFLLLLVVRDMTPLDRRYFAMTVPFFLLIYLAAFSNTGNFSMRGMFLPSFVLFYLFAKYTPALAARMGGHFQEVPSLRGGGRWARVATVALFVVATSVGAFKMGGAMLRIGWLNTSLPYRMSNTPPPKDLTYPYRDLVFDRSVTTYTPADEDRKGRVKYNVEKLMEGVPVADMALWERELMRYPREGLY